MDFLTDALTSDLLLDSKTFDFAETESEGDVVRAMVIEAFDMSPADDIDFPEIYSRQRKHLYEDDDSGPQERMNDAFRILEQFSQIDSNTIKVSILKEGLSIYFRLKTGEELSLNLGGIS
ncbi:60S ribosomal export protein NMD3 [Leptospira weilii]|uniref:LIC10183 family protein n=1 Tax=Leptospira weilii TaxID=28184 RepID=UPI001EF35EB2|nr:60S ribosomal export protein NMD3 [Leptospira weilii]ULH28743.1 60S ribosomal export protein NMD3 [Leptospira weilii]ULH29999.1 60S ribosomal export protein NMD3 [Leptospira weilii]UPY76743.1 60S ribosomal export protein NMD3 [Leptospira weilii]UPY79549.1 60S ribosomal export protein NMD3 [Leptospira weilii]UPY80281.1 60S ribosomal export protein NMD3 [Leptospira weilii]